MSRHLLHALAVNLDRLGAPPDSEPTGPTRWRSLELDLPDGAQHVTLSASNGRLIVLCTTEAAVEEEAPAADLPRPAAGAPDPPPPIPPPTPPPPPADERRRLDDLLSEYDLRLDDGRVVATVGPTVESLADFERAFGPPRQPREFPVEDDTEQRVEERYLADLARGLAVRLERAITTRHGASGSRLVNALGHVQRAQAMLERIVIDAAQRDRGAAYARRHERAR